MPSIGKYLLIFLAFPAILHWNRNHFVVLYKINGDEILVADPASGLILFSPEEFLQCWIADKNDAGEGTGIVLLLEPAPR